jgi:hypothetical protein
MKRLWSWITGRTAAYVADPLDRGLDEIDAEQTTQETWLGDLAERLGDQPATPADLEPPPEVVDRGAFDWSMDTHPIDALGYVWPEWPEPPAVAVVQVPEHALGVSFALPPAPSDGGLVNRQKTYEGGRRCVNPRCGTPTTLLVCVNCTVAGWEPPPKVADGWEWRDLPLGVLSAEQAAHLRPWDFTPEDVIAPNFAWDDAAIARLLAAATGCNTCGADLDQSGLCADYGRFHATPAHLSALDEIRQHPAFWQGDDGDDAA